MRILFLSHYFPPEVNAPASRTYEHCKQWVSNGCRVTVVTCAPNHPRGEVYDGYQNKLLQRETMDGIEVIRIWTYVTANEGFIKRTLNYISYLVAVVCVLPWLPKVDVVVSTSPQFFNGLAGYFVSRVKRVPWVLEIRDLWPESILAVGAIKNRFVIRVLEFLEMFAYRKSDRIVPVTDSFKRYMIGKGIQADKIEVIKNGVDLSFFQLAHPTPELVSEFGLQEKFVASYFGTHGMAHHLETVLQAADRLRNYPEIVFLLVGDGAERARLLAMQRAMGLTNVLMIGQQPKSRMPALWALSAVSLVLLKKSELFKTVIPSKIFESLAMERPIILGVEGESRELVEASGGGLAIEPENAEELARRVLELYKDRERCQLLGRNGRRYVVDNFDRVKLAARYQDLLISLVRT